MKKSIAGSLAMAIFVAVLMTVSTTAAVFTDSAASMANTFSSGSIDLKLSDGNETAQDNVTGSVAFSGLKPTLTPGGAGQEITVKNAGTLEMKYQVTLGPQGTTYANSTRIEVRRGGTSCAAFDGAEIANTTLNVGFTTAYSGTIAPAATDRICVRLSLTTSSPSAQQGTSTSFDLNFSAVQTKNNP